MSDMTNLNYIINFRLLTDNAIWTQEQLGGFVPRVGDVIVIENTRARVQTVEMRPNWDEITVVARLNTIPLNKTKFEEDLVYLGWERG